MAREINRLSARAVATDKKPGLKADGGGLYLQVSPALTKSWIFRFTWDGRLRDMGLGAVHTVSLSAARDAAAECRVMVRDGIDPIARSNALKKAGRVAEAKARTFKECAAAYIEAHRASWKNAKHADQWGNTLAQYAYPVFGDLPVAAIDTGLVLKVLEPIWKTKTETASRVRGRIENILDWARVRNYRDGENPARWRGHLDKTLPKRSRVQKVIHHPAMPYEAVGGFVATLRGRPDLSARVLDFIILTAARTGEVISARWDEFDLADGIWTVPAERMKARAEHRVPLAAAALSIVSALPQIDGSEFVFPGTRLGQPISNMACLKLLQRMGHGDVTVHGFRSTFRDWAAEQTAFPREVAERALAHTVRDQVEAAYQRRDLFDKRRQLMNAWADFLAVVAS